MVGTALDALEVLLLPSDVEHLVAVPAAQRGQSLAERYALPAIGADAVFSHPGKARRILGTRHHGPAVRRAADDVEERPRDVDGFAEDVEEGLSRPQLFHMVPRATAERAVDVRSQPSPVALGSHRLARVRSTPTLTVSWGRARPQMRRSDAPAVADACHNNTARGGWCLGTSGVSPSGPPGRRCGGSPSRRSRSVVRPPRVFGRGAAHVTAPPPTAVASPPCCGSSTPRGRRTSSHPRATAGSRTIARRSSPPAPS